jgi:Cu/Zn superoxide dismutase
MVFRRSARALAAVSLTAPAVFLGPLVHHHGPLTDLQSELASPTDGARGSVTAVVARTGGTLVVLRLRGLDRDAAGRTFGAHLHVGPCVADDGAAAGPHYNHDTAAGRTPPVGSADTEVWLDVTVGRGGTASAVARVDVRIDAGAAQSVVVHEAPTDPDGVAGGRLACLPIDL